MIQALIGPVTGLLDKFIEDKDQKNKLAHEIATMAEKQMHEQVMAQLEVNKAEAQHRSIFVAGWRPFIGWTCGIALMAHFVLLSNVVTHIIRPADTSFFCLIRASRIVVVIAISRYGDTASND